MNARSSLVLATGSAQARALVQRLSDPAGPAALARVTLMPGEAGLGADVRCMDALPGTVNEAVLALRKAQADAVIDGSHAFDAQVGAMLHAAARKLGLPYLRLLRPTWDVTAHPRWRAAATVAQVMPMIAPGARVFATTGWPSLSQMAEFPGETLLLRQTTRRERGYCHDFVEPVFGLPPFTKASETQLFEEMGVDLLLARNLGGTRSFPKLAAAQALGLDVILVSPPPPPEGASVVWDVDAALHWWASL